jgi:C4-dicarboxylate transporter DctQ subunit
VSPRKLLSNLVEAVSALLVSALAAVVFFQVLNRYVFKAPLPWSEDLAMLLFQWVAFLGAAVGVRRARHFGIELAVKALPRRGHDLVMRVVPLFVAAVAGVMVVYGVKLVQMNSGRTFATMPLSYTWAYLPIPLSGALMLVYLAAAEIGRWRQSRAAAGAGGHA